MNTDLSSWFNRVVGVQLRRRRGTSRVAAVSARRKRRPLFEALENRRMLTTPAVGSFERLEGITDSVGDLRAFVWSSAATVSDFDRPDAISMTDDTMVREYVQTHADDDGGFAQGFCKSAGFILTDIGDSTPVPQLSIEAVEIATAEQSGGATEVRTDVATSAVAKFIYDDPDVYGNIDPSSVSEKMFYGAFYIPAVGLGFGAGEFTRWVVAHSQSAEVRVNDNIIASADVSLTGDDYSGGPGDILSTTTIWRYCR